MLPRTLFFLLLAWQQRPRGSHLITDAHASYSGVEWLGYSKETYNHSAGHFGVSNHIEYIWSAMKRHLRKLYGCIPTQHLTPFLREWEARHKQLCLNSPVNSSSTGLTCIAVTKSQFTFSQILTLECRYVCDTKS